MLISSRTNPLILSVFSLRERKNRESEGCFFFEGKKLFEEALASKELNVKHILMTEAAMTNFPEVENIIRIAPQVAEKLSQVGTNDGIFCVANMQRNLHGISPEFLQDNISNAKSILILSSLQDPGNVGTIVRTAYAFGIDTVVISADCADIYNTKTIRASAGMLFRQKVYIAGDMFKTIRDIKDHNFAVYASSAGDRSSSLTKFALAEKSAFVLGNEGQGISQDIISACDGCIYIPMINEAESLNVSSAATVLCWELFKK